MELFELLSWGHYGFFKFGFLKSQKQKHKDLAGLCD